MKFFNSEQTTKILTKKLNSNSNFSFSRFGDGDLIMMYKESIGRTVGRNNKNKVTDFVNKKLIDSYNFNHKNYLIGTIEGLKEKNSTINNVNLSKIKTPEADSLYSAIGMQNSFLYHLETSVEFFKAFSKTPTIFVGGYNCKVLDKFYGDIKHYVQTPLENSTQAFDSVKEELNKKLLNNNYKVVFSCGQLARMLIREFFNDNRTMVDVGSVSDMLSLGEGNTPIFKRSHILQNSNIILNNKKYILSEL